MSGLGTCRTPSQVCKAGQTQLTPSAPTVDGHTHFTWTNAGSLDGLAEMALEEHTLFSARSARTFLDCESIRPCRLSSCSLG
jgi:hypothetical protein